MKPIYKINDTVEIDKTNKSVKIIDFEIFGDLILYYTNDNKAYPENALNHVGVNSIYELLSVTDEKRRLNFQEIQRKFNIL